MASVYLKRGIWYVQFIDGTGRRRLRSTKATTKGAARRLGDELEIQGDRQRLGLDPAPVKCEWMLEELCEWWLKERCPTHRENAERSRLAKHALRSTLSAIAVKEIAPKDFEDQLRKMAKAGLSAPTLNGLRGTLHTVFSRAIRAGIWNGMNPLVLVERRKVPKKIHPTIRGEEVGLLLTHAPREWRNVFAAALYTGLRKGELFGLKKTDVDLRDRTLVVARSYDNATTKGRRAELLPISEPLVPYLRDALVSSPSEYVFPESDGSMRTTHSDPEKVLSRTLGRAGLVTGYEHICRRCKAAGKPASRFVPTTRSETAKGAG